MKNKFKIKLLLFLAIAVPSFYSEQRANYIEQLRGELNGLRNR
jgi:hypothetical protein